jgi:hypothetical protein
MSVPAAITGSGKPIPRDRRPAGPTASWPSWSRPSASCSAEVRQAHDPVVKGETTFTFVTGGIDSAITQGVR